MMVGKLGGVEPILNVQNTQKTEQTRRIAGFDSINLSPEAQKLNEIAFAMDAAKAAPDIRIEKIQEVSKKLQDPLYIDSVLEKTAERFIDSLGF